MELVGYSYFVFFFFMKDEDVSAVFRNDSSYFAKLGVEAEQRHLGLKNHTSVFIRTYALPPFS